MAARCLDKSSPTARVFVNVEQIGKLQVNEESILQVGQRERVSRVHSVERRFEIESSDEDETVGLYIVLSRPNG